MGKYNYITLKVSPESRAVIDEVMVNDVWRYVDLKDVIALAWPRCPSCGAPLVNKFASQNLVCVKCKAEYKLAHVHV
jgi:tRNA(Ile2) C34 agmatinyltransferase TiaS